MIQVTFTTKSRTWTQEFPNEIEADKYRRRAYGKWRATTDWTPSGEIAAAAKTDIATQPKSDRGVALMLTKEERKARLIAASRNGGSKRAAAPVVAKADPTSALLEQAHQAGCLAAQECVPTPMVVVQHADPTDDNSPIIRHWEPVNDGVCGFAWVTVRPSNCKVAKEMEKRFGASKNSYSGGMQYWIFDYNQSMQKKEAYANAFAKVLQLAGIKADAGSRMD